MSISKTVSELTSSELIELHRALGETACVKDMYTERGTHLGCGECCSRMLPMTNGEVNVIRHAVAERGITLRPERGDVDFTCPLLDEDGMCMVYDVRPMICR